MIPRGIQSSINPEYKIVIVGDPMVGKTCIINRLVDNIFLADQEPTISPGMYKLNIKVKDGTEVTLNMWDTAGQEKFNCIVPIYARNSCGVIITFDITNKHTQENLDKWYDLIQSHVDNKCIFFVLGNKSDLVESDDISAAVEWANDHQFPYYCVSAKTGERVKESVNDLAQIIYDERGKLMSTSHNVDDILNVETNSRKCCW